MSGRRENTSATAGRYLLSELRQINASLEGVAEALENTSQALDSSVETQHAINQPSNTETQASLQEPPHDVPPASDNVLAHRAG
ncbi:hypothetical protein T484DRAFT_1914360 [Baffinella frigidus]|nr:hypothetical protein T484DRAFT_1914360 [Cryptophyta sp. CCMP2293]